VTLTRTPTTKLPTHYAINLEQDRHRGLWGVDTALMSFVNMRNVWQMVVSITLLGVRFRGHGPVLIDFQISAGWQTALLVSSQDTTISVKLPNHVGWLYTSSSW